MGMEHRFPQTHAQARKQAYFFEGRKPFMQAHNHDAETDTKQTSQHSNTHNVNHMKKAPTHTPKARSARCQNSFHQQHSHTHRKRLGSSVDQYPFRSSTACTMGRSSAGRDPGTDFQGENSYLNSTTKLASPKLQLLGGDRPCTLLASKVSDSPNRSVASRGEIPFTTRTRTKSFCVG